LKIDHINLLIDALEFMAKLAVVKFGVVPIILKQDFYLYKL